MKGVYERLKSYEPLWESWYVVEEIGKGSTSVVYKLNDNIGDGIYSAVKVISIEVENEHGYNFETKMKNIEAKKDRAVQEIQNMYILSDCPYVVHCNNYMVKEIYESDGIKVGYDILIRMDYYQSFSKLLNERSEPLSENEVIKLADNIGKGLKAAHDVNMMHRDIKPQNFFVDNSGNYLLGDLGISKQIRKETSYATLAGSQPYIAPEVWRVSQTRSYTRTSDIYSFGIVLYELLNNNCLPLTDETSSTNEIQSAIDRRLAGAHFSEPANGSRALKSIVMKACQYNSEDRYQSMDEMMKDLTSVRTEPNNAVVDGYTTQYADTPVGYIEKFERSPDVGYDCGDAKYRGQVRIDPSYREKPTLDVYNNKAHNQLVNEVPIVVHQHDRKDNKVNYTERNGFSPKKDTQTALTFALCISGFIIIALLLTMIWLFFLKSSGNKNSSDTTGVTVVSSDPNSQNNKVKSTSKTTASTTKKTTRKTTTTATPTDAEINRYDEFDTTLVVRVDEANTLPLRSQPNKEASDIITRIPDGTTVHVLGYKDAGSEIWFRVEYDSIKGWCRGGMLQPNNLGMLYDSIYNKPGLEKWKAKFQLQTPSSTSYYGSASFKGTLYFLPDLSSGVQKRFKSYTTVDVYSKQGDWYYVEFYSDGYYYGWVHQSQLSF